MNKTEMTAQLTQRSEELRKELVQMQEAFNNRKEQLIKVEGALEALSILDEGGDQVEQAEETEVSE